jgi:hypothetical protein
MDGAGRDRAGAIPRALGDVAMLNNLDSYQDAGRLAGKARRQHDEAAARFHTDHYKRMRAHEANDDDKRAADTAFNAGYAAGRGEIKPEILP